MAWVHRAVTARAAPEYRNGGIRVTGRELAGLRIAAGFEGYTVPDDFITLVRSHKVSTVILFKRNIASAAQTHALCAALHALILEETGHPGLIAIDQEGGAVSRLEDIATRVPCAMALASAGDPLGAREAGFVLGAEISVLGIDINLAPVLDVNSDPRNPVIGVRSFGDSGDAVALYGAQMINGLTDAGVLCCAKHFPGHGSTSVDSHLSLPRVDKFLSQLEALELIPFRAAIAEGVSAVMTAHILFPALEREAVPATMSRAIITGLLREKMGFGGLVLSDCMMMQAISDYFGTVNGCVAAARAGCDIIFVSHSTELAGDACRAIANGLDDGCLSLAEAETAAARILATAARPRKPLHRLAAVGNARYAMAMGALLKRAIAFAGGPGDTLPPPGKNPLIIGPRPFRQSVAAEEPDEAFSFSEAMQSALGGTARFSSANPDADEIAGHLSAAAGHGAIIAGTCNGHLLRGQLALVHALCDTGIPVICVALKDPYDLAGLRARAYCVAAYGYDAESVAAVADVLSGHAAMTGVLPVALA
jgi:beta-N-acetylhexosaminidase